MGLGKRYRTFDPPPSHSRRRSPAVRLGRLLALGGALCAKTATGYFCPSLPSKSESDALSSCATGRDEFVLPFATFKVGADALSSCATGRSGKALVLYHIFHANASTFLPIFFFFFFNPKKGLTNFAVWDIMVYLNVPFSLAESGGKGLPIYENKRFRNLRLDGL